jgi:hypothetical protein
MKRAVEDREPRAFDGSPGVTWRQVCPESGQLAVEDCPDPYREIFVEGHAPSEPCPVHHRGRALDPWRDEQLFENLDREQRNRAERGP